MAGEPTVQLAHTRPPIPRWDQQLRQAKNSGRKVMVQLAVEAFFADGDCIVTGTVLEADRAGIKVRSLEDREFWIGKNFIVGTEVLADE